MIELGKSIPGARRRVIEGQGHDLSAKVLVPVLVKQPCVPGSCVSAPVPAASWDNPDLPPEADDVLARGLEKRPVVIGHSFGGLLARVVICALIVFFPIAIATMVGIRSTDPLLAEMLHSLGATNGQRTRLLEVPSALPIIFGGLRVGVTLAVIGAVVAEWAGASVGLGVLINIANQGLFDTPLMFVALAALAIIGLAFYGLVVLVERRLVQSE